MVRVIPFFMDFRCRLAARKRLELLRRMDRISRRIECVHTHGEALAFVRAVLSLKNQQGGCIVEAGCYKGGSTAKFSCAARLAGRRLVVFDSFEGIPKHSEHHTTNIFGKPVTFTEGEYRGDLTEVKGNVSQLGEIDSCTFVKGWFEDTLPQPENLQKGRNRLTAPLKELLKHDFSEFRHIAACRGLDALNPSVEGCESPCEPA